MPRLRIPLIDILPGLSKPIKPSGPVPCKVMFVGEAPGVQEIEDGVPFVGATGNMLRDKLRYAGFDPDQTYMTNLFLDRPAENKIQHFMQSKDLRWPPERTIKPELWEKSLPRLLTEIDAVQPNLIVTVGRFATWALTGQKKITACRGTLTRCHWRPALKVLPVVHPSYIMRGNGAAEPQLEIDLCKAWVEHQFPELRHPFRTLWLEPTLDDIRYFMAAFLAPRVCRVITFDVETKIGQITSISFAPSLHVAISIPIWAEPEYTNGEVVRYKGHSYWPTPEQEVAALRLIQEILLYPQPKQNQNILYDIQYIWRTWGFRVRNVLHDSMFMHHALQPEQPKSLGFLGSIYTNELAWKTMRHAGDDFKRED